MKYILMILIIMGNGIVAMDEGSFESDDNNIIHISREVFEKLKKFNQMPLGTSEHHQLDFEIRNKLKALPQSDQEQYTKLYLAYKKMLIAKTQGLVNEKMIEYLDETPSSLLQEECEPFQHECLTRLKFIQAKLGEESDPELIQNISQRFRLQQENKHEEPKESFKKSSMRDSCQCSIL